MFSVVSWNVNSIRARLDDLKQFLSTHKPDFLALQETKVTDELFPHDEIEGYQIYTSGQPSYNGVAWLTKHPVSLVSDTLEGFSEQKRWICIQYKEWVLINVYVPNGESLESDKYNYKLGWLEKMNETVRQFKDQRLLICGDFNIAPMDLDVHDPKIWCNKVIVSDPERHLWNRLLDSGLTDVYRSKYPNEPGFTWWDYRGFGFRRNHGLRIDHFLISNDQLQQVKDIKVDVETRQSKRPSDHAPLVLDVSL